MTKAETILLIQEMIKAPFKKLDKTQNIITDNKWTFLDKYVESELLTARLMEDINHD